ncbi:hypothetical protein Sru01_60220 [Sphaerisporangium rufum]|uniref:O-methyltransferase n=1 Tax=Sphaerisporangium rufum TaxID=1381558 RepID=A0A919RA92_9ACTN|nr:DUF2218 domain-containing protein [Sphaerisporangium rufum]GII81040.1 hypothetical protein Sru01_60220 [Sphaerisporangium rufum]
MLTKGGPRMPLSTAHVTIEHPAHRVVELIHSLGDEVTARLGGDGRAAIISRHGTCSLVPRWGTLVLIAAAPDLDSLTGVRDLVTRHLSHSAAGQEVHLDWTGPTSGDALEPVTPAVQDYLLAHCTPPDRLLTELAAMTREATGRAAGMQVTHDGGVLLEMLVRLSGARSAIEIGVFTGYSSLCIARALPDDGRLLACDVSTEWTGMALPFWERAGVRDRIDLQIGPALETLRALPEERTFDFAFIDADKAGYPAYCEEIIPRLVTGGLLVLDNVFLGGTVLDPAFQEADQRAIREVNEALAQDDRLDSVMLPVRDGVTLARKR